MKGLYKVFYLLTYPFITLLYWHKTTGRVFIPEGAAVVCANHSSNSDPLLLAYALTRHTHLHFMAKAELFRIPVLGLILRKIGIFPVDRAKSDITAIKTAMKYLKAGEKVAMFPEGRRVANSDGGAKTGAVRLAVRMGVPVLPVHIPRRKRWFSRVSITIGEPYTISLDKKAASPQDYNRAASELMERIEALGGQAG